MKDKILRTDITSAVEAIAKALRAYSGEKQPLFCDISISTRRNENEYDQYEVYVTAMGADVQDYVLDYGAKIYYRDDVFGCEEILKTVSTFGEEDKE